MVSKIPTFEALELISEPTQYGLVIYGGVFMPPKVNKVVVQGEQGYYLVDKSDLKRVGVGYTLSLDIETTVGKLV